MQEIERELCKCAQYARRIAEKERQLDELAERKEAFCEKASRGANWDGVRVMGGKTPDPVYDAVQKMVDVYGVRMDAVRRELTDLYVLYDNLCSRVGRAGLDEVEERYVRLRYFEGRRAGQVALAMGYSESQALRIRRRALGEMAGHGVLEAPVSMRGTSPFYLRSPREFAFAFTDVERPMRFTFAFPFRFSQGSAADEKTLTAGGHFPAALELHVFGPASSPVLNATDADGKPLGELDLTGVAVGVGESVYWSSKPNETVVKKVTADGEEDLVPLLDVRKNNFFTLPAGTPVKLALRLDVNPGAQPVRAAQVRVHEYFRG